MKPGKTRAQKEGDAERRRIFWDFEVALSRAALKTDPRNVNALSMLGNALTRTGRHTEALDVDRAIVGLQPDEPVNRYNLACSFANTGEMDLAVRELARAVELGYRDVDFMMRDPDLKNLRKDPRFHTLILALFKKAGRPV